MSISDQQALATLNHHARSFSWGGFFLPRQQLLQAAHLYRFCRLCDDLADLAQHPAEAKQTLQQIAHGLRQNRPAEAEPEALRQFLLTAQATDMPLHFAESLLEGLIQDLEGPEIQTLPDLLRYCYQVAGTVGGMMCAILGVKDPAALPFAVDLGIAMQLTNICRDVREDAAQQRVYLPERLLNVYGLSQQHILQQQVNARRLAPVIQSLLNLAERYYQSGFEGMKYIPLRARLAILVAARLYRGIGLKITAADYDSWSARRSLSKTDKIWQVLRAICQLPGLSFQNKAALGVLTGHDAELHLLLPEDITQALGILLPERQP